MAEQGKSKRGILERLDAGEVVIGDGGFVFALEKRGYVKAGVYTPECVVEFPEAVRQLHREFLHAGADVMQAYNYYASEDKLFNRGNEAQKYDVKSVNEAACRIAREVADTSDALVAGGVTQIPSYMSGLGKEACLKEFSKQVDVLVENGVDFIIGETFSSSEEAAWAVQACKQSGLPVAMCLAMSGEDDNGVPFREAVLNIAEAGADIIGVNCLHGPIEKLKSIRVMKDVLEEAGIQKHVMVQPIGYHTPEHIVSGGFTLLPEFPFALEPRTLTRFDVHRYAREAYNLGVRYIGGCCGFEAYHIRAIAEELSTERGKLPASSAKHGVWGEGLRQHTKPWVRARASRAVWENLLPASGRPHSAALSLVQQLAWVTTAGHKDMQQHQEITPSAKLKEDMKKADT